MNAIVYILGIVLQAVAAVIALAQVRHAPHKLPWLLIALSSLLIVARRTATLSQFMETGRELAAAEIITLIVSLLFFLGVILMTRMFRNILQNQVALQQSEESLRRQRTLLQNMERISKVGGWEYDITAKRMIWTDEVYRIYGVSPETYDPNQIQQDIAFYTPEDQATIATAFQRASEQGEPYDLQLRLTNAAGKQLWVRTIGQPEFIEGRVIRVHGNIMDITEAKRAGEIVRHLQKAESLTRMAGAIAHHFNNQLGAVMGNLELAMIALPRGAGAAENLTEAMQAARRAARVSGLMLTYLGQTRGKREPLDLSETCRRSLPMLQAAMPKDLVLETDLPSPGPTISADANQIQQVLTNLCTNAWEAAGDGRSAIRLIVKAVSAADIPAAPRFPLDWQPQEAPYACLEVADTGCGISEKDIEKLFDPFFSTKFTGRGLGLPVTLGIVRTHGGVITVQSEPGHGSIFQVFFPVSAEAVPRPPEKTAGTPEAKVKGGGTVLLVEDLDMMRNMTKSMLALLGFSVLEARDGVEALEVFRQRQDEIRLVLCDLTMPRMDGWETLTALRKLAPGIPVILSSGHNEARVMAGEHPTLPEAFLSKPYGFKELRDAIASALASKK
jgi:PAS domain S-box-containing protein